VSKRIEGRLAERPWRPGDELPAVGSTALISGANCDIDSDQHRSYAWRRVIGYTPDDQFVCLQSDGCWPTVERTVNCWIAEIRVSKREVQERIAKATGAAIPEEGE
jgi:hypothetical protein